MKERLDIILLNRGLVPSREKARALIMEGLVFVNGEREDKAGSFFNDDEDLAIEIKGNKLPFVSRGGLKLEKAFDVFPISVKGDVCVDIGASTGGFTDCMLQNGAKKVYAIDVGYGQLDWKLRSDERVVSMEKTNFRYVVPDDIGEPADFCSCDVSFISLDKILGPAYGILKDKGEMVCLIKPQFEAGRQEVGKKGVVRDIEVHRRVIKDVINKAEETGFLVAGLSYSPIKGPEGNIEYLLYLRKDDGQGNAVDIIKVTEDALNTL